MKKTFLQPTDKSMFWIMLRSEVLQWILNRTPLWFIGLRNWLLKKIVAEIDGDPYSFLSPIHFQQGNNTHIGKDWFSNFNCVILDHEEVRIGNNVMFAPNVTISTVSHPMIAEQRNVRHFENTFEPQSRGDVEMNAPVTIGNNVWLGIGVIVLAGVTIGDNSVIGAGSVVTRDIPPNVFACGVPCRVVREITEADRVNIGI